MERRPVSLIEATIEFKASDAQYILKFTGDHLIRTMNRAAEAIEDLAKALNRLAEAESTSAEMRKELALIVSTFSGDISAKVEEETRL